MSLKLLSISSSSSSGTFPQSVKFSKFSLAADEFRLLPVFLFLAKLDLNLPCDFAERGLWVNAPIFVVFALLCLLVTVFGAA